MIVGLSCHFDPRPRPSRFHLHLHSAAAGAKNISLSANEAARPGPRGRLEARGQLGPNCRRTRRLCRQHRAAGLDYKFDADADSAGSRCLGAAAADVVARRGLTWRASARSHGFVHATRGHQSRLHLMLDYMRLVPIRPVELGRPPAGTSTRNWSLPGPRAPWRGQARRASSLYFRLSISALCPSQSGSGSMCRRPSDEPRAWQRRGPENNGRPWF